MNFLSHYYFDKDKNAYQIFGTVFPDLLKNAMNVRLHPEKNSSIFTANPGTSSILIGWNNHLAVDKYFHNSSFFFKHTAEIKVELKPILEGTQFRPSFLAHITLELILDHLLISQNLVSVEDFYIAIEEVEILTISDFLEKSGIQDATPFFNFLSSFKSSRYLISYRKPDNIAYALNRICMRVWPDKLDDRQLERLTNVVLQYSESLSEEYLDIFQEIQQKLA